MLVTKSASFGDDNGTVGLHPSASSPAGASKAGFAVALSARASSVTLGQPVWVTVEVRNVSGREQNASYGGISSYRFSIVRKETGETIERNDKTFAWFGTVGGPRLGYPAAAGGAMYRQCRLDDLYKIREPGTYQINVVARAVNINGTYMALPESNAIVIRVLP
jgi:hypothetical protein